MVSDHLEQHTSDMEPSTPPAPEAMYVAESVALLRTVQQHHVQLSAMADQKAGFLIGGSVVLLGLVLGQISDGGSVALLAAGTTAILTLALSIVAVIPRFYRAATEHERPNLMFFGVFAQLEEDEFIDQVLELTATPGGVRRAFLRDIHQMGKGLNATKFRYLAYAFRVALGGMALAFIAAIVEYAA